MARYIDADKFLEDEIRRCGCVPLVGSCTTDNESLAYQLAKAPTADVVEVVRCKGCKYFMEYNEDYVREVEKADGDCYIRKMYSCDPQFCAVKSDDFCSYGERKDT